MMNDKKFDGWVPAHGFPRELQRKECSADILSEMNDVSRVAAAVGSSVRTVVAADYKNTDQTLCEYDDNAGAFVGCSNQAYHSGGFSD